MSHLQLVEGKNVEILLFMFSRCSAGLAIGELLLSGPGGFHRELGGMPAPRVELSLPFSL